jgi:integrase
MCDRISRRRKINSLLTKIEDHWRDTPVNDISAGAIRAAAQKLYPDVSAATRNRQVITPTIAVINHAADLEWCSPIKGKKFKEGTPKLKEPVDLEWVTAFADQATEDGMPHLATLCVFMFGTGARVGECTESIWADIDFMENTATINQGKTDSIRVSHLPQPVIVRLANIGGNRDPDDKVFGYAAPDSIRLGSCNQAGEDQAPYSPLMPSRLRYNDAPRWH